MTEKYIKFLTQSSQRRRELCVITRFFVSYNSLRPLRLCVMKFKINFYYYGLPDKGEMYANY